MHGHYSCWECQWLIYTHYAYKDITVWFRFAALKYPTSRWWCIWVSPFCLMSKVPLHSSAISDCMPCAIQILTLTHVLRCIYNCTYSITEQKQDWFWRQWCLLCGVCCVWGWSTFCLQGKVARIKRNAHSKISVLQGVSPWLREMLTTN